MCGRTGLKEGLVTPRGETIPGGEAVRVVDGADVWLSPCDKHAGSAGVDEALGDFRNADGKLLNGDDPVVEPVAVA